MRIIILGASGFIGGHLLRHLSTDRDSEVTGIYYNNPPVNPGNCNLKQLNLLDSRQVRGLFDGCDIVIQAAASTTGINDAVNSPAIHVTDNAIMNSIVLREAAESAVKKFIFLSCTVMYQKELYPFRGEPVLESDDNLADEIYSTYLGVGWTKVYIEKMCKFYSMVNGIETHCIRHSNIYGPYDKFDPWRSHVIGATIRKMYESEDGPICVWGDGQEFRDYLYIDDLVSAIALLVKMDSVGGHNLWNVGSGELTTIESLVRNIRKLANRHQREIIFDNTRPTARTGCILDSSKLFACTGWRPKYSLDDGLIATIDWYKNNYVS